ncbi:type 2 isopentenyl-diphosphate Delta-isomerase [Labrenzia aggregata]|uniref:Isopentenyl-diphosphate delta-isomerase n=2 Tax=Roseibium aggregatum TaxID=187304 RepID=A0A939J232_9HYPH|nr:type 2 isopentenyl-diphosphate Delta-isomerase [Roseibium aggregatum]
MTSSADSHGKDTRVAGRKMDHLRALEDDADIERNDSGFDRIKLTHRALPELDFEQIDTRTTFLEKPLSFPLLISSMTGGPDLEIETINRNLARAAEQTGVAMAVGSQRVMFTDPAARKSFDLRSEAPNVPLIGNIGAVQLNMGLGADQCLEAIELLKADALYLHVNPLQEAVQPEGDRNFSGLAAQIRTLAKQMPVPLLLKEVGCGLSVADIDLAWAAGIRHFDIAGRGGTSWSRIEYLRRNREDDDLGLVFQDWGLRTVDALCEARAHLAAAEESHILIASGGIRNGVDMAKCIILGADMCGLAAPLLKAAKVSSEATASAIEKLHLEFRTAMFLLGCGSLAELKDNASLIRK